MVVVLLLLFLDRLSDGLEGLDGPWSDLLSLSFVGDSEILSEDPSESVSGGMPTAQGGLGLICWSAGLAPVGFTGAAMPFLGCSWSVGLLFSFPLPSLG